MVPKGWKRIPLEQVAEVRSGVAKGKTGLKDPVTVPYLRVANVQDGHINLDEVKEIEIERDKMDRFSLKKGDVLMNEGGDFDKLGRGDVWQGQIEPCLHQNHVFAVRPNSEMIDSFFLAALAASYYGKTYFLSCAKRSTNLASINSKQIKEFPALVPPLSEQKKIAKILSTWDKAINTTEQLLANSHQQKKALMQQLLTGKKRLLDNNGVRFSGEWAETEIGSTSKCFSGGTPSRTREDYFGGSIPWITSGKLNDRFVDSVDEYITDVGLENSSAKVVKNGSLLIAMYGATAGKVAINNLTGATINQAILALEPKKHCDNIYLFYLLELEMVKALNLVQGGQPNFNASIIKGIKVCLPSVEEQQKIAAVLSTADQEITTLQQKLDALKQEKQALMQQLLTGKRRVKVEEAA